MDMTIHNILTDWFIDNSRELPWKSDQDPYKIWVSEILLQQTRVEQAKPYYERFISLFPGVADLAAAPLDQVLRLWQGLGYYSRARNMHTAAKQVMELFEGRFPTSAKELALLKGVGPYTAAAIAAFAYDEPVIALDGNIYRIFSRLYAHPVPINTPAGRRVFSALALEAMGNTLPSLFNQALMDFGSGVCTPQPKCDICPLAPLCSAFALGKTGDFPRKRLPKAPRSRYFYYLHITLGNKTFMQQRTAKDIWQGLWQFPLIETHRHILPAETPELSEWQAIFQGQEACITGWSNLYLHRLTHQLIHAYFLRITLDMPSRWLLDHCLQIPLPEIDQFGISRLTEKYLSQEP
ncbi:MAG: A/G-specific adenine glycosylase [Bacteroidetes bacterium]|nr:A/G-specific adenine glycosylase [Bacteroidota bacterium]